MPLLKEMLLENKLFRETLMPCNCQFSKDGTFIFDLDFGTEEKAHQKEYTCEI